jgi:hypothetical protein
MTLLRPTRRSFLRSALAAPAIIGVRKVLAASSSPVTSSVSIGTATISQPLTYAQLTAPGSGWPQATFPDPFTMINGYRITKKNDWYNARVPEIKTQYQYYLYGTMPASSPVTLVSDSVSTITSNGIDPPTNVTGSATLHALKLTTGPSNAITFYINVYLPSSGIGAPSSSGYPIFIGSDQSWCPLQNPFQAPSGTVACDAALGPDGIIAFTNQGFIMSEFGRDPFMQDATDYSPQSNYESYPAYSLYSGYTWGSIGGWAWGWGRALDYIIGTGSGSPLAAHLGVMIDTAKVMGAGHSRGGQASSYAGMLDSRMTCVVSNQCGDGGNSAWRCYACGGSGPGYCSGVPLYTQSLCGEISYGGAPGWMCPNAANFNNSTGYEYLPFDGHCQLGACAPRLYCALVPSGFWDPEGNNMIVRAARQIYTALGLSPNLIMQAQAPGQHQFGYGNVKQAIDFAAYQWYGVALPANDYFGNPYASAIFNDYYPNYSNNWTWTTPTLT